MYPKLQYVCVLFAFFSLASVESESKVETKPGSRIVGGLPSDIGHIPYIVSLMTYGFHSCGGAIINERTVITAAHCLTYARPSIMRVHVGSKTKILREGQLIPVAAIISHELWNMDDMDYDIGLVRLTRTLRYSQSVQPISLPRSNTDVIHDGTYGIISGWGLTQPNGMSSNMLRYARVPVVNQALCNQLLNGKITERMFCAGYLQGGIDACQMDSGGPLVIDGKLEGIVSWGIGCALPNKPGVYTRVSMLLPWVNEIMTGEFNEGMGRFHGERGFNKKIKKFSF